MRPYLTASWSKQPFFVYIYIHIYISCTDLALRRVSHSVNSTSGLGLLHFACQTTTYHMETPLCCRPLPPYTADNSYWPSFASEALTYFAPQVRKWRKNVILRTLMDQIGNVSISIGHESVLLVGRL